MADDSEGPLWSGTKRYEQADLFSRKFTPKDGVDYEWVWDYAQKTLERFEAGVEALEAKADAVISYLGAFSGIMAIVAAVGATTVHWAVVVATLPAFVAAVWAMWQASLARRTEDWPVPTTVLAAMRYAEEYGDQAKATYLPKVWAAAEAMRCVEGAKAASVDRATNGFMVAVALLALPLLTTMLWRLLPHV